MLFQRVLLLCGLFLVSVFAKAEEAPFLNIVTENWKPYNYEDSDTAHTIKGVSTDIVRKIFSSVGYNEVSLTKSEKKDNTYNIQVFPWSRSYRMATTQPNVAIYTIIRIDPRENLFKWACPLGKGGVTSLYKLKTNNKIHIITSIEDAKKYNIVANKDSMDETWLTFNKFKNLQTPSRVDTAIKLFEGNHADLIAFDDVVLNDEFKSAGVDPNIVEKVIELFKTPPYLAFSLMTSDSVVEQFKKHCEQIN